MKICLLKCGSAYKDLLHIDGDYDSMFEHFFKKFIPSIELYVYDINSGKYPDNLSGFDGFVSSGSFASVYEETGWIRDFQNFVKELHGKGIKHIGICFGHQMIARALGGKVERAVNGWGVGVKKMFLKKYKPWMDGKPDSVNLIMSHQDQVVKLPPDAEIIAGNDHCPVGIFSVGNHTLGIQAHPEFTLKYYKAALEKAKHFLKEDIFQYARDSMADKTDEKTVAGWIANFLKN